MGLKFKKTKKIGPLRINFSKHGIGYSIGNKFFRTTKTATGQKRRTITLPGTGFSYVFTKKKK